MPTIPCVRLDIANPVLLALLHKCATQAGMRVLDQDDTQAPDLLVRQPGPDLEDEAEQLERFQARNRDAAIFLAGDATDPALLRWAMRAGVRQFLPDTLGEEDLAPLFVDFAQERLSLSGPGAPGLGRLISVLSMKGGVGGTTVAVNVAYQRQRAVQGKDVAVALLDLGLPYGEAQMFLDLDCRYHWGDAVKNLDRLDNTYLLSLMGVHSSGLRLLPPPTAPDEMQLVGAEVMGHLVEQARKVFSTVVVDLGAYIDEVAQRIMEMSDDVLLVCVQSTSCVRNLKRFMGTYPASRARSRQNLHLLVNRHLPSAGISAQDVCQAAGLERCIRISNDFQSTLGAINQGLPLELAAPKSPVTRELRDLALSLGVAGFGDETATGKRRFALSKG
uniref:Cobyrinic acid a,c-diamide synthase n=1 Tax=Fundidesulfovibrio putealis TaxID=270496 RepID=A0A7C4EKU4_9BACT